MKRGIEWLGPYPAGHRQKKGEGWGRDVFSCKSRGGVEELTSVVQQEIGLFMLCCLAYVIMAFINPESRMAADVPISAVGLEFLQCDRS